MAKSLHSRYVDRRLNIARQQISFAENDENTAQIYQEGALDNALLQTYFAIFHYMNELLESYHQPVVSLHNLSLGDDFFSQYSQIPELMELKQLLNNSNSWFAVLMSCPEAVLAQAEKQIAATEVSTANAELENATIQLINLTEETLFSPSKIRQLIDQCYEFIQRQRESLIEY